MGHSMKNGTRWEFLELDTREAAVCALPETKPTDLVVALRKLTPVEIVAIGVGHRQIVLWTNGKGVHRPDTDTSGGKA
jgi:hypothetical protein